MPNWLDKYLEHQVEVYYLTDANYHDIGVLSDYGDGWLELRKPGRGTETFLVPVSAVRRVSILKPPGDERHRLLRPADDQIKGD